MENWDKFLVLVKEDIGKTAFDTWFSSIKLKKWSDYELILETPDVFFKDWIETHYIEAIKNALNKLGQNATVKLEVNPRLLKRKTHAVFKKIHAKFKDEPQDSPNLNQRLTFNNFVVGPSSHLAFAASQAVAEAPGKIYNPFFIYGKVGLGKTHLLQAIAHHIVKKKRMKIKYLSSERFANELINSIKNRSTEKFRKKYRNVDVILIDDIHFIAGKESTQEEFFHTFNVLFDAHKQIVLSSDRPPKEISKLEERLVSRFCWGLIVDIQPPNLETRIAILKKKLEKEAVQVNEDVVSFIAENITSNIRELEGALVRIIAYALIENKPIDLPLAKSVLKDIVHETPKRVDGNTILNKIAEYFHITKADLKSKKRSKNIMVPKQIAMFLLRELTEYSLPEIGSIFGAKHHTTILYAHKKMKEKIKKDSQLKNQVLKIKQDIQS